MPLENQVCSLDLSKRLKELGFKQDSLFYWCENITKEYLLEYHIFTPAYNGNDIISAHTVAELGEMLPGNYTICRKQQDGSWSVEFDSVNYGEIEQSDTEADARAKMLIYLKENNLI